MFHLKPSQTGGSTTCRDLHRTGCAAQPAPGKAGPSPLTALRSNAGAALALAFFGALLAFLDVTIVNVDFPDIQTSVPRSSYRALSWV